MPSFEILADVFTRISVFDFPKRLKINKNTFKTCQNINLYFKRRHLIIIYNKYSVGCCFNPFERCVPVLVPEAKKSEKIEIT